MYTPAQANGFIRGGDGANFYKAGPPKTRSVSRKMNSHNSPILRIPVGHNPAYRNLFHHCPQLFEFFRATLAVQQPVHVCFLH